MLVEIRLHVGVVVVLDMYDVSLFRIDSDRYADWSLAKFWQHRKTCRLETQRLGLVKKRGPEDCLDFKNIKGTVNS